MLPDIRQTDYLYPIPKFDLNQKDIEDFERQLEGYHDYFADCFKRIELQGHFYRYMAGQFCELERKSIEPIAFAVEGGKVRAMQRFVSDAIWDEERILHKYHDLVNEDLGDPDAAIIFDESGFVKKGENSIGVARQYCGTIGKVENCQIGVFAAYTSSYGYALIDKRLYIPEKWFSEEYSERCKKNNLPGDVKFQTKPQLAAEMLLEIDRKKQLPFRYILADSVYATNPDFIDAAESLINVTYMGQIPKNTLCWLKRPATIKTHINYKGKPRVKKVLSPDSKTPISAEEIANNIHDFFWYRRKVSEGTKGPIEYEFTKRRVVLSREGLPTKTVWLFIRRSVRNGDDNPIHSYYISNAAVSTRLDKFVWLSGLRWSIEQCFEETKTELGMDQYEVRKYHGWHHHMLTCILAHFFLWHLKIIMGKKSTSYYSLAA